MKKLDMADKYDPLSYQDEEPTVRVQQPYFFPQIVVGEDGHSVEIVEGVLLQDEDIINTHDDRDTIPAPPPYPQDQWEERRYPGVGLILSFGTGLLFWGFVAYLLWRH
jgi:hypothetical protein